MLVSMGAYLVYDFIKSLLQPQTNLSNVTQAPAPENVELLSSLSVRLQWQPFPLEEKATPEFVNWWNEIFSDLEQYDDLMEIGQLLTTPEIPGLYGQLIGYLCYKWKDSGVFLQLFEATNSPAGPAGTSWLVYLDLKTLQWQRMVETGACILDVTPDEPGMLLGWLADGTEVRLHLASLQPGAENPAPEEQ